MKRRILAYYVTAKKTKDSDIITLPTIFVKNKWKWGYKHYVMNHVRACVLASGYEYYVCITMRKMYTRIADTELTAYDGILDKIRSYHSIKPATCYTDVFIPATDAPTMPHPDVFVPPPYIPKRGELKLNTKLEIDWENPKNHGISVSTADFWISEIAQVTTVATTNGDVYESVLYQLSWNVPKVIGTKDGQPLWGVEEKNSGTVYTADGIFNWLRIINNTKTT
jgi:hypothetical protein